MDTTTTRSRAEGTTQAARPLAPIRTGVLLTLGAWIVSRETVGAAWALARYPFTFRPSLWIRWDSFNYLSIAMHGSTFGRCHGSLVGGLRTRWCGTTAWLPAYPWLMRALNWTGMSLVDAGLLIAWLAVAATMFLLWFGWARDLPTGRAFVVLVLLGLFPGSVYNFALFPTALALACVVGSLVAAIHGKFLPAAVLMAFAGLCYPSALYAAIGLAVGLVLFSFPLGVRTVVRRALWGLAGLSSLLVLGFYDQLSTGHATAFFRLQAEVRGVGSPWQTLFHLIGTRDTVEQRSLTKFYGAVLALQALLSFLLAGAGAVVAASAWHRKKRDAALIYPALVGVAVVLGVLLAPSTGAWNRSIVLAAPCVVLLRRMPLPLLLGLVAVVGTTTALMARTFFNGSLV